MSSQTMAVGETINEMNTLLHGMNANIHTSIENISNVATETKGIIDEVIAIDRAAEHNLEHVQDISKLSTTLLDVAGTLDEKLQRFTT